MARFGTVDYLAAEHVARVTMDRAVKRNALDDELIDGLDAAFAEAERDPDVHVVVLAASVDEIAAEIATIPTHAEQLNRDTPIGSARSTCLRMTGQRGQAVATPD